MQNEMTAAEQKPLFVPLKTKWFEQFRSGEKRSELRLYGPRWNERTCPVGRRVVLSKGYGKAERLNGTIREFYKRRGDTFGSTYQAAIVETFGTVELDIAEIRIDLARQKCCTTNPSHADRSSVTSKCVWRGDRCSCCEKCRDSCVAQMNESEGPCKTR